MKKLSQMNDTELFCVLAGSEGIMPQIVMSGVVEAYEKHTGDRALSGNISLSQMVRNYIDGAYDSEATA